MHTLFPPLYSHKNAEISTISYQLSLTKNSPTEDIIPLSNNEYRYIPSDFLIDDTSKLESLNLLCKPTSFGYSVLNGISIFPPFTYPQCSLVTDHYKSRIYINRDTEELYMDCDKKGYYLAGPSEKPKLMLLKDAEKWEEHKYKKPVDSSNIEFAIGNCGKDDDYGHATMIPRFNKTLFNLSKNKTIGKPKIIFFLTLDSLSRRHFYRKLPSVISLFLNFTKIFPYFNVYDFKLHSTIGEDSVANQVPILGGLKKFVRKFSGNKKIDYLNDTALWNILRDKGYISLLGFDDCDKTFSHSIGQNPNTDYTVRQFYCLVEKYAKIKTKKKFSKQKCLGPYQTHYYLLNYTMKLAKMYKGVNMWLYLHLNAAHEATGQHAATLDLDIRDYLINFITEFQADHEIIFFNGDHGMRYGEWHNNIDAIQEKKLPALFIVGSKSLLNKYPNSNHCLSTNTERLISKLDLRETMLSIAGITENSPHSINLFTEIASKDRNCFEIAADPWNCPCAQMKHIKLFASPLILILDQLIAYAENTINSLSYSTINHPLGKFCKKVILDGIKNLYHLYINNVSEVFRLEIKTSTKKKVLFEINYFLTSEKDEIIKITEGFRIENIVRNGYKIYAKVYSYIDY